MNILLQKLIRLTNIGEFKWEALIGKITKDQLGGTVYNYDVVKDRVEWDSKNFVIVVYEDNLGEVMMALVPKKDGL